MLNETFDVKRTKVFKLLKIENWRNENKQSFRLGTFYYVTMLWSEMIHGGRIHWSLKGNTIIMLTDKYKIFAFTLGWFKVHHRTDDRIPFDAVECYYLLGHSAQDLVHCCMFWLNYAWTFHKTRHTWIFLLSLTNTHRIIWENIYSSNA